MRKLLNFILSIILLISASALMPACESNDGFEIVAQIDFTTNGEQMTKNSTKISTALETIRTITENEFAKKYLEYKNQNGKVDYHIVYSDEPNLNPSNILTIKKQVFNEIKPHITSKRVSFLKKTESTEYYYLATKILGDYRAFSYCKLSGQYYSFVLVKIIDNQTIQIADTDGITTYTVSSYKLTYFKEKE